MAKPGEQYLSFKNRTIERTQGCWNCKHFDLQGARDRWLHQRQRDLQRAMEGALVLPGGESHQQIVNIRHMINTLDHAIASGKTGQCRINAVDTDFVNNAYLCDKWSGAEGAAEARNGQAPDKLPEELMADAKAQDEKLGAE